MLGRRMGEAFAVEIGGGVMDGLFERVGVGEGLVGKMMDLEVAPDRLDVVEFGRVFRQSLDGQPVRPGGKSREGALAGMDRAIVLDQCDRLCGSPRLRAVETVDLLKMGDEVAAATRGSRPSWPGPARARTGPIPTSPRRGRDRDGSALRSRRRTEERCRPPRPAVCTGAGEGPHAPSRLASGVLSACAGAAASEIFFRKALDSRERLMRTPSRTPISMRRRGIVQLRRSATGACSKGAATRKAASLFSGGAAPLQRRDAASGQVAAPQAHRILAHAERLRDLRAGPARQRQKHGARPVPLRRDRANRQEL